MQPDNDNLPSTPKEAKAVGRRHYFTGEPCARGHVEKRYTSTAQCTACQYENRLTWKQNNPDKERKSRIKSLRKWAANHPETKREMARISNAKHSAKNVERVRRWKMANPERHAENQNAADNRRRARLKGADGTYTADDVAELLRLQRYKCAECGASVRKKASRHVDHIMPIAKGGSNDKLNIQILCVSCNLRKSDKHPLDFARERGRLV